MTPVLSIPMRHFLEVARSGSVNQAAARLYVAASAVSRQIVKLEESLGTALFERRPRGMVLTPAGERLAAHLRHTVLDSEQVIEQVRDLGGQRAGRIRVAVTEGFAGNLMPHAMREFQAQHDHSRFELHVGAPSEVSALLARAEADIGLKYVVAPETGLQVAHSVVAPVYAAMSPAHPLARQRVVQVSDVVRYPLVVGSRGVTTTRQLFDLACSEQGLQYQANFVSNFSAALLPLMRTPDILLAGLHTLAHLINAGTLVARPFAEVQLQQRRLQVLQLEGRTLPVLAQSFVEHLLGVLTLTGRRRLGRARQGAISPLP